MVDRDRLSVFRVDHQVQKSGHLCSTEPHKRVRFLPIRNVVFTWLELACKPWCMMELACKLWCSWSSPASHVVWMISAAVVLIAHEARGGETDDLCKMQQIPQHPPPSLFTIPFLLPPPHFRKLPGYSAT
jgi:hypothetical protein